MSETFSSVKEDLVGELNTAVTKGEQFLKTAYREGEERTSALRGSVERNLRLAKERLRDVESAVTAKTKETARAADAYVHENPWRTVGAAAGIAAVAGVLIGMLLYRK